MKHKKSVRRKPLSGLVDDEPVFDRHVTTHKLKVNYLTDKNTELLIKLIGLITFLVVAPFVFIIAIDKLGHHCVVSQTSWLAAFSLMALALVFLSISRWLNDKSDE